MGITKEMVEANLKQAEEAVEQVKVNANIAIGNAIGRRDLLKQQLDFFLDQEKAQANSAQEDTLDAHPVVREAQVVAEAAVS